MIKYYDENLYWYHEISSQDEAENSLKSDDDLESGTFLIMPNSLDNGDLTLSLLHQNEIFHYQIHRVQENEDPFYSINGTKIFHGVDSIVEYYSDPKNITTNALITHLVKPIKGALPPKEILCHGRTNLLHKAIIENDEKRILELIKEDNRNINARDQDDLIATHLACLYECSEKIFKYLLKAGAKITSKDISGNTPLHYACRGKSAGFIKALVDLNPNIIHMRNPETGYVPLHDAAKFGNIKAIQVLLKHGATTMPRTKLNEFPLDLAIEAGHFEVAEFIKRYSVEPAKTKKIHWFHGTLTRQEANNLVQEYEKILREKLMKKKKHKSKPEKQLIYANLQEVTEEQEETTNESKEIIIEPVVESEEDKMKYSTDGVFLIRQSARSGYALSLWSDNQVKHFIISESLQHFYLDDGPYFASLEHLVQHYSAFSCGLPINLRFPVPPKTKPPLPEFSTMPKSQKKRNQTKSLNSESIPELPEKTGNRSPLRYFSHPGDEALKRIGGLFDRSPTPSSASGNSSTNQIDQNETSSSDEKPNSDKTDHSPRESSIFASLRFSKTSPRKNFIMDGMRSLRKTKNKLSPSKSEDHTNTEKCKPRSIFHDVEDLIREQQLADPEFNIRTAQDLMKNLCFQVNFIDPIYKVPTNNRAVEDFAHLRNEKIEQQDRSSGESERHYEAVENLKKNSDTENDIENKNCNDDIDNINNIIDSIDGLSETVLRLNDNQSETVDIDSSHDDSKLSIGEIRNSLESNDSSNNSLNFKTETNSNQYDEANENSQLSADIKTDIN